MHCAILVATAYALLVLAAPMQGPQPSFGRTSIDSPPKITRAATNTGPTKSSNNTSSTVASLLQALQLAITEEDRLNILVPDPSDPTNLLFQFKNNSVTAPTGGTIDLATVSLFPALLGTNIAMAIGFVNPCALNTPHTHLRANEFLTVIQGSLTAGLITENNPGSFGTVAGADPDTLRGPLPQVTTSLSLYEGIMFPQGSVHWQFNPACEPAVFAAAFDSNDPGRMEVARAFLSIEDDDVVRAALGDTSTLSPNNIDKLRQYVPSSYAQIISECAVACGIYGSS